MYFILLLDDLKHKQQVDFSSLTLLLTATKLISCILAPKYINPM